MGAPSQTELLRPQAPGVDGTPAREGLLAAVRELAPNATWSGDELIVPGPAALRPRVLDRVRELGIEVRGLTADEGQLGELYRELVAEAEARSGHGEVAP